MTERDQVVGLPEEGDVPFVGDEVVGHFGLLATGIAMAIMIEEFLGVVDPQLIFVEINGGLVPTELFLG